MWGDVSSNLTQFLGHIIARLEPGFITELTNISPTVIIMFCLFYLRLNTGLTSKNETLETTKRNE